MKSGEICEANVEVYEESEEGAYYDNIYL